MAIYSAEEIEILRENNILVSKALAEIAKNVKPGITTEKLDKIAHEFICDNNAEPGFLGFHGYPKSICASVNDEVVHGIPSNYILKDGDIISVDIGTKMKGFYGDSAYTFAVGEISDELKQLLQVTKESLFLGIEKAVAGNRVGDISFAVQNYAESHGYSVVRELVGHGLGTNMHEAPEVPNYGRRGRGVKLSVGQVICIEPMINMGRKEIRQEADGWTIKTIDGKSSAHFELAVAIDNNKADILSTFKYIEEVLEKN